MLLHRPGASALHKGPDGLSRNPEGRDQLILAKSTEWSGYRNRIKGICDAIATGQADDDEPESLTAEAVEKTDPEKLVPLPSAQGLAVSLNYERGNQERKFQPSARGDAAQAPAKAASGSKVTTRQGDSRVAAAPLPGRASKPSTEESVGSAGGAPQHLNKTSDSVQEIVDSDDAVEQVAQVDQRHKEEGDVATVSAVAPKTSVVALFVGPFVLDQVLHRRASFLEGKVRGRI